MAPRRYSYRRIYYLQSCSILQRKRDGAEAKLLFQFCPDVLYIFGQVPSSLSEAQFPYLQDRGRMDDKVFELKAQL
jgi:hypothetical protein